MTDYPRRLVLLAALLAATSAVLGCRAERVRLAGIVERKALELSSPISEVIVSVPVAVGDPVRAGQVVVKLDTTVAEAELKAHQAAYAAAEAALVGAEGEFKRVEDLRKARVSTQQALDQARRARDEALAVVAEKAARIAQSEKRLEDLTVRSHAAGVVDQLPFEEGERAPAGGVVAVVVAAEAPWVRVWLPARAVARLGSAAEAEVRIEGLGRSLTGVVDDVAREPEFTPHYALTERESAHLVYQARVVLQDAPSDLRSGLPAQVSIVLRPVGSAG